MTSSPQVQAAAHGASLSAACARHQVRRLFAITGLDRRIQPVRTMTKARQNLTAARATPSTATDSTPRAPAWPVLTGTRGCPRTAICTTSHRRPLPAPSCSMPHARIT